MKIVFQKVYMVWDLYDGARTGLADFNGVPHYFSCVFSDQYTDKFELSPVSDNYLALALEQWKIYRDWELQYNLEDDLIENHPGNGGVSPRYDELDIILKSELKNVKKTNGLFRPEFRVLPNQEELPTGVLREVEVAWHELT